MVHLPCGKSKENTRIELYEEIISKYEQKYELKSYFDLLNQTQFPTPQVLNSSLFKKEYKWQ